MLEKSADLRLTQPVDMKGRRRAVTSAHNHPGSCADLIVARHTKDVESLLAAQQNLFIYRKRKDVSRLAVDQSFEQKLIIAQKSPRHRPFHQRPRRPLIVEELAFLQRFIARLVGHLLLAGSDPEREEKYAGCPGHF